MLCNVDARIPTYIGPNDRQSDDHANGHNFNLIPRTNEKYVAYISLLLSTYLGDTWASF